MDRADRVGPAGIFEAREAGPALRLGQRVAGHALGREDVFGAVGRDDVPVARQHHRRLARPQAVRMRQQRFEPGDLIIELGARHRIAVGQVDRSDPHAADIRLQITAMAGIGIVGKAALGLRYLHPLGQDGDAVPALLPMPDRIVAERPDLQLGEALVRGLEFLQADDVGLALLEPFEQARQPRADAVDVVGRDLHGAGLADCMPASHPAEAIRPRSWCRSRSPKPHWDWSRGMPPRRGSRHNRRRCRARDRG